jgi:RND family efflux transporter MFP subunit
VTTSQTQASSPAVGDAAAAGGELAYLDQALWKRFHTAAGTEEFAGAWLALQCSMLPGIRAGVVVLGPPNGGPYAPAASWPDDAGTSRALTAAAEAALQARKGVVNKSDEGACAAYPIQVDGQLHGVAAVDLGNVAEAELRKIMRQLQWGCGWVEANLRKPAHRSASGSANDAALAVELAALVLEAEHFHDAATAIVTELATRLGCERASLGVRPGRHTKVVAISHSTQLGKSSNLVHAIGLAMDEAIDQYGPLVYPQSAEREVKVDRAHAELAAQSGDGYICTIPLADRDTSFGALTLEAGAESLLADERLESIQRIATFLGPVLASKHREDRWIGRKVSDASLRQVARLVGPRYVGRKIAALIAAAVAAFFGVATDTYRVQAEATLEGAIERVAVAPIAGYIIESNVRPGDVVAEGDQLFRIDDRDLRLEFLRWSSQKAQIERQQRDALAQGERTEVNILRAQLDQAESQLTLISEQIARTRGVAPFDGFVVSGDLSDQLGAPVERGQVLFTIAPLDQYRVALRVAETDVSEVHVGQRGQLVLAASPNEALPIEIASITPVSEVVSGRNTFRLEGTLGATPDFLRPGMQGAARIEVGERRLGWIWTHELVQWLSLRLWSWWP